MPVELLYNLDISSVSKWNMITPTASAKASMMYAQEIGDFWAGPDYFTSREGFDSYLLKFTVDGRGQLDYNGQRYDLRQGHFFWIDCSKKQYYRTAPDHDHWHIMWVHFWGGNARFYYEAFLNRNNGSPVGLFPIHSKALSLFESLLSLDPSSPTQIATDFQAASLLTQLVTECVLSTLSTNSSGEMPQIIQGVRMHLQNHYQERMTLDELGALFNVNPQYLQRQFKRHIGMSPTDYLIFLRMARAKELLRTTKMTISEIAAAVGMDNLPYFTTRFKKEEGITPMTYRKLWPGPESVPIGRFTDIEEDSINQES